MELRKTHLARVGGGYEKGLSTTLEVRPEMVDPPSSLPLGLDVKEEVIPFALIGQGRGGGSGDGGGGDDVGGVFVASEVGVGDSAGERGGESDYSSFVSTPSSMSINMDSEEQTCGHCGTRNTPLWRRHPHEENVFLCNACGLFLRMHGIPRPEKLRKNKTKPRRRRSTVPQSTTLTDVFHIGANVPLTTTPPSASVFNRGESIYQKLERNRQMAAIRHSLQQSITGKSYEFFFTPNLNANGKRPLSATGMGGGGGGVDCIDVLLGHLNNQANCDYSSLYNHNAEGFYI